MNNHTDKITKAEWQKLEANSAANMASGGENDFTPVVKLFTAGANATWLLTEYDPNSRLFFGLCDLGQGFPELGYVSRDELEGMPFFPYMLEKDLHFGTEKPISHWADEASLIGSV